MSDLAGLPLEQSEPVSPQLRMLASVENLGALKSVHRPLAWSTRLVFRQAQIYLFDQGFLLGPPAGPFRLFRWGQIKVRQSGGAYVVVGADRRAVALNKKWSGFAQLAQAIAAGSGQVQ